MDTVKNPRLWYRLGYCLGIAFGCAFWLTAATVAAGAALLLARAFGYL